MLKHAERWVYSLGEELDMDIKHNYRICLSENIKKLNHYDPCKVFFNPIVVLDCDCSFHTLKWGRKRPC